MWLQVAVSKTQQASAFEPTLDSSVWYKGEGQDKVEEKLGKENN